MAATTTTAGTTTGNIRRLRTAGARPINGASLAVFRIAFGVFMVVDAFLYLPILVSEYYVDTTFTFPYDPWGLVQPLPGPFSMHLVYVGMVVAGVCVALGLRYRVAMASLFVFTTYIFLIDSTYFQNHEYLISLLSFALIFLPLHRTWSLDARRRPEIASRTQPAWMLWFLRFQIGVPYFFGAIAKINPDWLRGEPLRMWLADRTDVELIGRYFTNDAVVWFANYGSLLLDLTVVGFLLNRRTRMPAFVIAVTFHLLNARLFGLFVFPWLMIAATTLFFDPDWPYQVRAWWQRRRGRTVSPIEPADPQTDPPPLTTFDGTRPLDPDDRAADADTRVDLAAAGRADAGRSRRAVVPALTLALAVWVGIQVTLPMRHLAIPGDANWTEEGHRFAWHMMLRTKSGTVTFIVDDGERTWTEDPYDHLGDKQAARLAGHPERLARFAHHLSDLHGGAEVRAETSVRLNGREPAPIVDPDLDLASVQVPWWGAADWILPNPHPLPDR